ncbi:MAG TPA: two-component regulator propeller domain-containing protein [Thermohalobaculum sp.]|nr:two-component regulator propeller domain-containing protein [Thermohalobaculum sp.]
MIAGLICGPVAAAMPEEVTVERFQVGANTYVRALAIDEARGSVWVGTSAGAMEIGLDTREPKQVFTRKEGLANEYVFAIGVAPGGEVWFGTNGGGTSRWKDGDWKTFFPMHGLADYWVYSYSFDDQDRVWIGTWDGANLFDPATGGWVTYHDELINIWVYGLDIDDQGRVWFGTEGGVSMFDGKDWTSWTHDDGLGAPNRMGLPASENNGLGTRNRHDLSVSVQGQLTFNPNYVFAAKVDDTGRGIWFGTWGGGASLFDGDSEWTSYTLRDGLPGNIVYSIAQDADGVLWFGTDNGVAAYDGTRFRSYPTGHGAEHIYAIAIAPDGSVWAGAKGAALRLTPAE